MQAIVLTWHCFPLVFIIETCYPQKRYLDEIKLRKKNVSQKYFKQT